MNRSRKIPLAQCGKILHSFDLQISSDNKSLSDELRNYTEYPSPCNPKIHYQKGMSSSGTPPGSPEGGSSGVTGEEAFGLAATGAGES